MRKNDLIDGDIVTLRNGNKLCYINEEFKDMNVDNDNNLYDLDDLTEDMTYYDEDEDYRKNDIVKVERPINYETIYERTVRKMTMTELCKKLGYEVEIIKEDE